MSRSAKTRSYIYWASLASTLILLAGCLGGFVWIPRFEYSVEALNETSVKNGDSPLKIGPSATPEHNSASVLTEGVEFKFRVASGSLHLGIENPNPFPISFLANKALLTSDSGTEFQLWGPAHSQLQPVTIPAHSAADVSLRPAASNRHHSLQDPGHSIIGNRSAAETIGEDHIGRSFTVELPVLTHGAVQVYHFRFTVTGFKVRLTSAA